MPWLPPNLLPGHCSIRLVTMQFAARRLLPALVTMLFLPCPIVVPCLGYHAVSCPGAAPGPGCHAILPPRCCSMPWLPFSFAARALFHAYVMPWLPCCFAAQLLFRAGVSIQFVPWALRFALVTMQFPAQLLSHASVAVQFCCLGVAPCLGCHPVFVPGRCFMPWLLFSFAALLLLHSLAGVQFSAQLLLHAWVAMHACCPIVAPCFR